MQSSQNFGVVFPAWSVALDGWRGRRHRGSWWLCWSRGQGSSSKVSQLSVLAGGQVVRWLSWESDVCCAACWLQRQRWSCGCWLVGEGRGLTWGVCAQGLEGREHEQACGCCGLFRLCSKVAVLGPQISAVLGLVPVQSHLYWDIEI